MKLVFVSTLCLVSAILDPVTSSPNHSGYLIQHLVPYRRPFVYFPPPTYPPAQQFYAKPRPQTQRPYFNEPQKPLTTRRPKPTKPPEISRDERCEMVASRDITTPSDLEPNWRILNITSNELGIEIDPKSILEPPLEPIPRPIPSIKENKLLPFNFKLVFSQNIKLNLITNTTEVKDIASEEYFTKNSLPSTILSGDEIQATLNIYKLPTSSAPLRGYYDIRKNFENGLENSKAARRRNAKSSPVENFLENDLNFMVDLFKRVKDAESLPKNIQPEESIVELPQVISRLERNFIPEPDHSERTVLDFGFNFGLPVMSHKFGSPAEIGEEVQRRKKEERFMTGQKVLREFRSLQRFAKFVGEKIGDDLTPQRRLGRNEFVAAEEKVQREYRVGQFIVCTSLDKCEDCRIDPILEQNQYVDFYNGGGRGGGGRPSGRY